MPKAKGSQVCLVENCNNKPHGYGLCSKHYQRSYLYGRLNKANEPELPVENLHRESDGRRSHHQYHLWHPRKMEGLLCREWADDFWKFAEDIGERPSKQHYFAAINPEKLFSPTNFEWREKLARREGETKKEWNARKWQSRRKHHPSYEANRFLKRKYGITIKDYERMKDEQAGVCAICKKPETAFDPKIGAIKGLSVDHCHTTKKVRGLLCFRCNSLIGKAEDDVNLLQRCIAYLGKHHELLGNPPLKTNGKDTNDGTLTEYPVNAANR